ncbi:helix-turn-helix transcriptional regulator [Pedobacter riviphilus]|uniref:Helix-turn-helix transcriptional regulator n=1 Tax=Pedobacter riviphilus TaxID=2766984 RepID=A0ABX6TL68_9SPHI|nr:AraC family transcriptional regulator [Pedobacter riviphilus]QNR85941.1 helix-turn-helix transcriptional regulator [Pedobacter riviphilus]
MAITFIDDGIVSFSKKNYSAAMHSHYALELAFANSGSLNISTGDQDFKNIQAAIISPNTPHVFDCSHGESYIYFIDPTTTVGEHLINLYNLENRPIVVFDAKEIDHYKSGGQFSLPGFDKKSDKKISDYTSKCIKLIHEHIAEEDWSIDQLARQVFVSESRLAHIFKQDMNISIRQYILWKKIEIAAIKSRTGCSLTESAHHAGFTDSSHFIKTFKKMFGVRPSFAMKS